MRTTYQCGIVCFLLLLAGAQTQTTNSHHLTNHNSSPAHDGSASRSPATCVSGSVNYITHTLPQQCATSSRSGASSAPSVSSREHAKSEDTERADRVTATSALDSPERATEQLVSATGSHTGTAASTVPERLQSTQTTKESQTLTATETSTSTTTVSSTVSEVESEAETDSPLDNANFLSFEEWRKENLEKAGQSPEHVGQQHRSSGDAKARSRPGINNALDVLGEDSEIELDFSGFGSAARAGHTHGDGGGNSGSTSSQPGSMDLEKAPTNTGLRSKDAGKTCKERTNYASFDCAATVVKTNKECKSSTSVLIENKDSYMLNVCGITNKFFIVELCDDILVDTVVLANYEFFSSIFRTFRLSVSDRYPVKADRWKELGIFEARNTRDVQAFLVEQPLIWARYLRVEFLSHYGNEYYCPVSLIRVHGTTMMEEFRHQEEIARGEYPEEGVEAEATGTVTQEPEKASQAADESVVESIPVKETKSADEKLASTGTPSVTKEPGVVSPDAAIAQTASNSTRDQTSLPTTDQLEQGNTSSMYHSTEKTESVDRDSSAIPVSATSSAAAQPRTSNSQQYANATGVASIMIGDGPVFSGSNSTNSNSSTVVFSPSSKAPTTTSSKSDSTPTVSPSAIGSQPVSVSTATIKTNGIPPSPTPESTKPTSTSLSYSSSSHSASSSISPSHPSPPQPLPSTQESFFKSIHKRLQSLESNATLSLQYIESQSRNLRDAFSKVEKRQIRKTEDFLKILNSSVVGELESFRRQYDLLWQSTVLELEAQRMGHERELGMVGERLGVLAEELVWLRRMVGALGLGLGICFGVLIFSTSFSSSSSPSSTSAAAAAGRKTSASVLRGVGSKAFGVGIGNGNGNVEGGTHQSFSNGSSGGIVARSPFGGKQHPWWISPPNSPSGEEDGTATPPSRPSSSGNRNLPAPSAFRKRSWWRRSTGEVTPVGTLSEADNSADERLDSRDGTGSVSGSGSGISGVATTGASTAFGEAGAGPELNFQPPTPTSYTRGENDAEEEEEEDEDGEGDGDGDGEPHGEKSTIDGYTHKRADENADPNAADVLIHGGLGKSHEKDPSSSTSPKETQSSPATPTGTRDGLVVSGAANEEMWATSSSSGGSRSRSPLGKFL